MQRFKFEFRNRSLAEQINICERIVAGLAGQPAEHLRQAELPDLQDKVAAARASHDRIAVLRAELKTEITRRKTLVRNARDQAIATTNMVGVNMKNDPAKMLSVGVRLTGPGHPVGQPGAPLSLRASPTASEGEARLRWQRPVRECTFEIEYRLDTEPDGWKLSHHCLRQSCVVKGLVSGGKYWFRVRAFNAHGPGPWSNLAPVRVK